MTKYMEIARALIGAKEISGTKDNPVIMEMYRTLGHDWVEHDETAWCAAFVGYCLERAGLRSTRKLNARSYLDYGNRVPVESAREGDIAIFSRGKSSWQGHVGFVVKVTATSVQVLGGNQADAVNIKSYPRSRLLGIVRPAGLAVDPLPDIAVIQRKLRSLGYYEVGSIDGRMGSRTRAAILAFRADNGLPTVAEIDRALIEAMKDAPKRAVAPERAEGVPTGSRILKNADGQIVAGVAGTAVSLFGAVAEAVTQAEQATDVARRGFGLVGMWEAALPYMPYAAAATFIAVMVSGYFIRRARIDDHRRGKTPFGGEA